MPTKFNIKNRNSKIKNCKPLKPKINNLQACDFEQTNKNNIQIAGKQLLESPEPTKRRNAEDHESENVELPMEIHQNTRIVDQAHNFNQSPITLDILNSFDQSPVLQISTQNNKNKKKNGSKKKLKASQAKEYSQTQGIMDIQILKQKLNELDEATDPCSNCCEQFYKEDIINLKDFQKFSKELQRNQQRRRRNRKQQVEDCMSDYKDQIEVSQEKKEIVPGCSDANISQFQHYLALLRDERLHFKKLNSIILKNKNFQGVFCGNLKEFSKEKPAILSVQQQLMSIEKMQSKLSQDFEKQIEFIMPSEILCNLRNVVVNDIIMKIGKILKQNMITINLAIKIFDIIFVHQQEYPREYNSAVDEVKQYRLEGYASKKYEQTNIKNDPKNLQVLAAQCLLLSSKYIEVHRIYPAEIIYQVKSWGRDEFEILRGGSIEEFILNLLDFDLIILTPADFLQFYIQGWNFSMPVQDCKNTHKQFHETIQFNRTEKKNIEFLSYQICDIINSNLGPQTSLIYLPSQIASASIQIALQLLMKQSGIQQTLNSKEIKNICEENFKIQGYQLFMNEKSWIEHKIGINSLIQDSQKIDILKKYLQEFENSQNCEMQKISLSLKNKDQSKKLSNQSPSKKQTSSQLETPIKQNPKSQKPSSMKKQTASPCKQAPQLAKISEQNLQKFEKSMFQRSLIIFKKNHQNIDDGTFDLENLNFSEIYPEHVFSSMEKNLYITHKFFGYQNYQNIENRKTFKELLETQTDAKSLKKYLPIKQNISNTKHFFGNKHLERQLQIAQIKLLEQQNILKNQIFSIETPNMAKKNTKNEQMGTVSSFSSTQKTKQYTVSQKSYKNADKENQAQSELNIRANNYYEQKKDGNQRNIIKPLFTKIEGEKSSLVFDDAYYFNQINLQNFELKPILIDNSSNKTSSHKSLNLDAFALIQKDKTQKDINKDISLSIKNIMLRPQEMDDCSLNNESLNDSQETKQLQPKGIHGENSFHSHSSWNFTEQNILKKSKEGQQSLFSNISFYPAPQNYNQL